ncbi:DNA polymerase III subunit delta [Sulfurovum sp. AR]|uniref:DNA polymerase III subunit delta n=1 Tax=Sulfurovum sp. AR TaxID=1165841 RepID=UPI00025C4AC5|nr:DNA polymerase III subunit delta [Sulfurovum sp. AR]EIF50253.1 DNA polymerase III subunit delta [Sulfurovum sp. AR]
MYQREFDQKLKQAFPKAVLFYGENDYLVDHYIDTYIKKTDAKESMLTLYHDEWDFEQAKNFLSQTSLFGGTNLVVVKHDKKIPKKELDILIELANKSEDNYFLYGYAGATKDAKSMQAAFSEKKGGVWVRFFEPNIRDGIAMLQQKAQQIQLDIDHYALQHLMLILNNNLALCANELDKLAILGMKVTSKDIDRLVYSTAPLATEQLLIDLFNKKPITATITKLLELGEDEASLLRSTQYFVNQIFLFHAYIKLHGHVDSAAILGYKLPKQIEEQKAQLALRVKSAALLKIFEHLLESEILIKKAPGTQKEVLVYSMLIKLQGYL